VDSEQISQWARESNMLTPLYDYQKEQLQAFATIVRQHTLEEAAVVSWNHYMDTCKQRKVPAAQSEHFIAATAIRSMK
jgi:hypothetical protein